MHQVPDVVSESESEEDTECPVCCNDLDVTDKHMRYCECGFRPCLWCYHQILEEAQKDNLPARCPNCRSEYDQNKISMQHIEEDKLEEELAKLKKSKKDGGTGSGSDLVAVMSKGAKSSTTAQKAQLANIRVVQPNLVYTVGLAMDICHEDVLKDPEYFGQFGKLVKISVNRTNQYVSSHHSSSKHSNGPTGSAYVTFKRPEDALKCIKQIDGETWKGRQVKACFGTTKYCNAFLKGVTCTNPECLYLHEFADDEDCLTKEEVAAGLLPARFMAMGATNTFKPRLTIHSIVGVGGGMNAGYATGGNGGGNGGGSGSGQKYVIHNDGDDSPRGKRSVLVQRVGHGAGGDDRRGGHRGDPRGDLGGGLGAGDAADRDRYRDRDGSGADGDDGVLSHMPPPPPPPPPPLHEKGLWAAAAGSTMSALGGAHSVPPPTSDTQQWPTLAAGPGGFGGMMGVGSVGGLGADGLFGRMDLGGMTASHSVPLGGASNSLDASGSSTIEKVPSMAEQLLRAKSTTSESSGRLAVLSGMNKAPTPKLIPLTSPAQMKAMGKAIPKKAAAADKKSSAAKKKEDAGGGSNAQSAAASETNLSQPPQSMQGLQGIQLPPGFGIGGAGMGALGTASMPAEAGLQHLHHPQIGTQQQNPLSSISADSLAKPQVQPVRKQSRFAFAQQDEVSGGNGEAPHGTMAGPNGGMGARGIQGDMHGNATSNHPQGNQDAGSFFQSLFPGVHVNVGAGAGMPVSSSIQAGERANAPPGFSTASPQDHSGLALLRQLQIGSGSTGGSGTGSPAGGRRMPPGFGGSL